KHVLVIFDAFWPGEDSYLGPLGQDVADSLPRELDAVPDPRRLVLVPCAPGQVPLASPELGRSVFGHYLEEGLRGWADTEEAGLVSATTLTEYVQVRVDRWAQENRGVRQTPMLLGDARDFPLRALEHGRPLKHREIVPLGNYPEWLRDAWQV